MLFKDVLKYSTSTCTIIPTQHPLEHQLKTAQELLLCKCFCGKEFKVGAHKLIGRTALSGCGCVKKRPPSELLGTKRGQLTVVKILGGYYRNKKRRSGHSYKLLCSCECGRQRIVDKYNFLHDRVHTCGNVKHRKNLNKEQALNKLISIYRKDIENEGCKWLITKEEVLNKFTSNCEWCGVEPYRLIQTALQTIFYNHIAINDPKEHVTFANTITLCNICNYAKKKHPKEELEDWKERFIAFSKKKLDNAGK